MPPIKSSAQPVSILALLALLASPAVADESSFSGVSDMNVSASGATPAVTVRNVAANHLLQNLQLAVQENQIAVGVGGYVECTGTQFDNFAQRFGHFLSAGAFGIGRTSLLMERALPNSSNIDRTGDMDAHTFQMPVGLLANPQIDIDPAAIVLAAAEQAPDKLAWLRQNHVIVVKVPLRWEAGCAFYTRNKITKQTIVEAPEASYLTKDVDLKINYQGDPQLFAVNAQLGGNLPNQLQAGDPPLKITEMTFQPNMPHHNGACPATTKIRVFYKGQGQGEVRIRINDGGLTIHDSPKIAFDAKNGQQFYDFEIETPKASKFDLNKTVNHDLRVYVRGKDDNEQVWPSNYQHRDSALWKHRCTPQLNPVIGGAAGAAKAGGFQNNGSGAGTRGLNLKKTAPPPPPVPPKRLQVPADGDPAAPKIQRAQ